MTNNKGGFRMKAYEIIGAMEDTLDIFLLRVNSKGYYLFLCNIFFSLNSFFFATVSLWTSI